MPCRIPRSASRNSSIGIISPSLPLHTISAVRFALLIGLVKQLNPLFRQKHIGRMTCQNATGLKLLCIWLPALLQNPSVLISPKRPKMLETITCFKKNLYPSLFVPCTVSMANENDQFFGGKWFVCKRSSGSRSRPVHCTRIEQRPRCCFFIKDYFGFRFCSFRRTPCISSQAMFFMNKRNERERFRFLCRQNASFCSSNLQLQHLHSVCNRSRQMWM